MLEAIWSCVTEHYNLTRDFCMLGRIPQDLIVWSGILMMERSQMNCGR
jgi:hypothetical protein